MLNIHPTAIVSPKAKLGENITVDAFAIIHDNVEIGNDCIVGPHAVLYNGARLGNRVIIHQAASIAHVPQDLSFKNEESLFIIDDDTTVHEFVTCHRGTKSTGFSKVGRNCLLMAYTHVAHDCVVGNNCILANGVQLGGHVHVEDYAIIGGMTTVHQFSKVGQHSMTGGSFKISQDLPPFILAAHTPLKFCGLNIVGLRRRGFAAKDIEALKKAYNYIYDNSLNVSQAVKKIEAELGENDYVRQTLEFIKNSKRGLVGK
ncbi:MAG TPA: acyl-[acyl-carrier-protein]--UDP-N-acetylglucosamine O-acyltransferase [Ignavibacteriales bacterium]|nr:MAG: acyl-[acyl-carrier-protein]--UDP-N-acetylglucosamine O-acyltransferase [Ignavibacteria bacterium RBG_16_35_7]HAB51369.1 acyl-[acyl-carrier-protein]--UDP-N-acetylglucosamine O-acyltransferase [Ignavibacteriales bacterium]